MTDLELTESYTATTFRVNGPVDAVDIRVGHRHPAIDQLMGDASPSEWAFITAWNPRSELLAAEQNEAAQSALLRVVRERWLRFYEGSGIPDSPGWAPERSVWIAGISRADAIGLGIQLGQNAIVVGKIGGIAELVNCREEGRHA